MACFWFVVIMLCTRPLIVVTVLSKLCTGWSIVSDRSL